MEFLAKSQARYRMAARFPRAVGVESEGVAQMLDDLHEEGARRFRYWYGFAPARAKHRIQTSFGLVEAICVEHLGP